jgi:hypothetical protein
MGTFRDRGEQVGAPERANHSVLNWKVTCARPVSLVVLWLKLGLPSAHSAMASSVDRIDQFIVRKGYVPLANDDVWQSIIDRILDYYGRNLHYRCVSITQQADPLSRFFTAFPDNLTIPRRHIKYLELLVTDSPLCKQLVDWLHSIGVPTQRVFETADSEDMGALRIFGFTDPNHVCTDSTDDS